jgi:hypothetical protein
MKNEKIVTIKDIIKIIDENPKLIEINSNTKFDEGYQKSLIIDKKHGFKI